MPKLILVTYHTIAASGDIELPEGKGVEDIEDVFVKWGDVTITFKDGSTHTVADATEVETDSVDWKRPISVDLMDESYNTVYSGE